MEEIDDQWLEEMDRREILTEGIANSIDKVKRLTNVDYLTIGKKQRKGNAFQYSPAAL